MLDGGNYLVSLVKKKKTAGEHYRLNEDHKLENMTALHSMSIKYNC